MKREKAQLSFKLRRVFVPWLISAVAIWGGYSLLHWLALAWFEPAAPPGALVLFVLPLLLPGVAVVFWVRHGIRLLRWSGDNGPFLGCMLAWLLIAIPAVIVQLLLEDTVGTMTRLQRVSEVTAKPKTRFYSIRHVVVDKAHANRELSTWVSGRHSESWNVAAYYVAPVSDPWARSDSLASRVFLGVSYYRHHNNRRLSPAEKRTLIDQLLRESEQEFGRDDFKWASYFDTPREGEKAEFQSAVQAYGSLSSSATATILLPRSGSFDARAGTRLRWIWFFFHGSVAIWLLIVLTLKIDQAQVRATRRRVGSPNADLQAVLAFLTPRAGFAVTPILLHLNFYVWVAMVYRGLGIDSASPSDLLRWGAVHKPAILQGELWRLITSLFVHANLAHVAYNLIALGVAGMLVERTFGSWWFGTVYLVAGIAGGVATFAGNPDTVLVGASGSIFGVIGFGMTLLMLKKRRFAVERSWLLKIGGAYLGLNLLLGIVLPGIGLVAHVAGLASGLVLGLGAALSIDDEC